MTNLNDGIKIAIFDLFKRERQHSEPFENLIIDDVECVASVRFASVEDFIVSRIEYFAQEHQNDEEDWGRKSVCIGNSPYIDQDSRVIEALERFENFSLICSDKYKGRSLRGIFPKEALLFSEKLSQSIIKCSQPDKIQTLERVNTSVGARLSNTQGKSVSTYAIAHSKFLVLGIVMQDGLFYPSEVLTGSFNFTANATHSLENVVCVKSPKIATAFTRHWYNILLVALSQREDLSEVFTIPENAQAILAQRDREFLEEISNDESRRRAHQAFMDAWEHECEILANIPEEDR